MASRNLEPSSCRTTCIAAIFFSFDDMTQLPGPMREWLKENAVLEKPVIMSHITSNDGDTTKLLVKLSDGSLVETVCMHHVYGNSISHSSE